MTRYRTVRAVCALLLLLAVRPLVSVQAQDNAVRQRAEMAIDEGRYGEALSIVEGLIEASPRNPQLLVLRARAHEGREAYEQALADYQRALALDAGSAAAREGVQRIRVRQTRATRTDLEAQRRLALANPDNLPYRLQYADALYEATRYREAAAQYETYLGRTQGTPDILRRYLISLAGYEGGHQKGVRAAERYLQYYPTDDDLHMRLGYFRLWGGRHAEAIQAFEQALRLNPGNAEAQQGLEQARLAPRAARPGGAPRQTGAQAAPYAVDRLVRELQRAPDDTEKRFALVRELIRHDRFGEAYDHLLQLAPAFDTSRRWLDLFRQIDQGYLRTAGTSPIYPVDRFTYLLRLDPANRDTRFALVDALLEAGRLVEARGVLTNLQHVDPADERYRVRLQALDDVQRRLAAERLTQLEARLARAPDDVAAVGELSDVYVRAGRTGDARTLYRRLLQAEPGNADARLGYARLLVQTGAPAEAQREAAALLEQDPDQAAYQRLYVTAAVAARSPDARAEQYLDRLLAADPDDADLLLERSSLRLAQGQAEEADRLIRRALAVAGPEQTERLETQSLLVEREAIRQEEAAQAALLNDARRLAAARDYGAAVAAYEAYFLAAGRRTRGELKELAQVYTASGDFVKAVSILTALQEQRYEYEVAKEIASNRFYLEDYAGAIEVLELLLRQNPADFEVRMKLGDAYAQLQRYAQARAVYQDVLTASPNAALVEERLLVIEASSVAGLTSSDPDAGLDYVGLLVPLAEAVVARGSGTEYGRWAQGIMTQVTLPAPAVLYAGLTSHFLSGTRRLLPNAERVHNRVNQVYGGGYLDLTPALPMARASYTNRLQLLGGLFDYEGGRTVPFGELRYWHQTPGRFTGSVGVRATEGAVDLWSPAGGEFALRLTQFDVRAGTASVLPDSLLKLSAVLAYNLVTDNFGSPNDARAGTNQGFNVMLDGAYRVLPHTYLGIDYYQLSYRTTVDIYFSPRDFQTYSGFLEYEREYGDRWYLRVRGSIGAVARSNGFIARRLETDLIYRFARRWAVNVSSSIGQSTRSFGNETLTADDVYSTFIFAGQLYWTL